MRKHTRNRDGSDQVTEEHRGVGQEAALMRVARGDGEEDVEQNLQSQDESEDPDARATLLRHEATEGKAEGEKQDQQDRLREFPVAARVAEERDQDRSDTQGCSAHQARAAGEVSRAGHRGTLSAPNVLKATSEEMAFSTNESD